MNVIKKIVARAFPDASPDLIERATSELVQYLQKCSGDEQFMHDTPETAHWLSPRVSLEELDNLP